MRSQLAAMGCDRYEIGVRDPRRGILAYQGSADAIIEGIGWLKAMNARGSDIYVRPAGSSGMVLMDGLDARALEGLARDGLAPAAVTETGGGNYQAWVRLADAPLLPELATEAAREVAERYGGSPGGADWRYYGRLAGFMNREEEYTRADGRQPYVRLTEARGGWAPDAAKQVLARAQERFEGLLRESRLVPMPSPREEGGDMVTKALGTPEVTTVGWEQRAQCGGREDR